MSPDVFLNNDDIKQINLERKVQLIYNKQRQTTSVLKSK